MYGLKKGTTFLVERISTWDYFFWTFEDYEWIFCNFWIKQNICFE